MMKHIPKIRDFNRDKSYQNALSRSKEKRSANSVLWNLPKLEELRISLLNNYEKAESILKIGGNPISSVGNMTTFLGLPKVGKSAVEQAGIAGALNITRVEIDTLGMEITPTDGRLVLHIDSEQSNYDHFKCLQNILKRAKLSELPKNFVSLNFVGLSPEESRDALNSAITLYSKEFGGIHSIWIDGVGDFVSSVNDEVESQALVNKLFSYAKNYDCHVFNILHTNLNMENRGRGHLGSILQRKSEAILSITKDGSYSRLEGKDLRNAPQFEPIQFEYNTSLGYHTFFGFSEKKIDKKQEKIKHLMCALWHFFDKGTATKTYSELCGFIMEEEHVEIRTAKSRVSKLRNDGIIEIEYGSKTFYRLSVQLVQDGAFAPFCTNTK